MDAVECLKAKRAICKLGCDRCNLSYKNNGRSIGCRELEEEYPEEAVKIIEDWFMKNKPKTNYEWYVEWCVENGFKTTFLQIDLCPPTNKYGSCAGIDCNECKKWWGEIHEEKTE